MIMGALQEAVSILEGYVSPDSSLAWEVDVARTTPIARRVVLVCPHEADARHGNRQRQYDMVRAWCERWENVHGDLADSVVTVTVRETHGRRHTVVLPLSGSVYAVTKIAPLCTTLLLRGTNTVLNAFAILLNSDEVQHELVAWNSRVQRVGQGVIDI